MGANWFTKGRIFNSWEELVWKIYDEYTLRFYYLFMQHATHKKLHNTFGFKWECLRLSFIFAWNRLMFAPINSLSLS